MNRTLEDVHQLAEQAKLNLDELLPFTQCLEFDADLEESDELKLLELNSELLDVLSRGDSLVIRGDEDDASVLCTNNKTYEVRGAETSNSMLILPKLSLPGSIQSNEPTIQSVKVLSTQYKYIELKPIQAKLQKLLHLLEENPYKGGALNPEKCYTLSELLSRVQGSEEEILQRLKSLKAYKIGVYWTILNFDYHFQVLSYILNHIETMASWSLNAIPKHECLQALKDSEPAEILEQCFDHFFIFGGSKADNGDLLYQIIDDDICRFCAEVLLKPAKRFHLDEFLSIWQQSVPEGLCTSLNQLEGIAIIDMQSSPHIISYFPSSQLPENLTERFDTLFEMKEKWTMEEIRPYLVEYTNNKLPISALLTKQARASLQNGIKYFSRRHPK